jgi:prepilin-type N-terminal cleavage/methylation domain-containing protein
MNRISVRTKAAASRSAFTLVELLVVIAIIVILAGLLLSTSGYVQEKAGIERAKNEIAAISTALEAYKMDNGDYPTDGADGSDNSTKVLLDALSSTNSTEKVYFKGGFPGKMMDSYGSTKGYDEIRNSAKSLVDPFGNPYRYQYDPASDNSDRSGKGFFKLWSQGKKNTTDTNTWIKNWN